jgi:hypothetical protein
MRKTIKRGTVTAKAQSDQYSTECVRKAICLLLDADMDYRIMHYAVDRHSINPRLMLALAGCLQADGDLAANEYIRLHVQMGELPEDDKRQVELRERATELASRMRDARCRCCGKLDCGCGC